MIDPTRYDSKPLLRLLELYVLKAIGELSTEDETTVISMTPKLKEIYNHDGDWAEIIGFSVDLPEDAPQAIKRMWVKNQKIANDSSTILLPQKFAEMFVDENFGN